LHNSRKTLSRKVLRKARQRLRTKSRTCSQTHSLDKTLVTLWRECLRHNIGYIVIGRNVCEFDNPLSVERTAIVKSNIDVFRLRTRITGPDILQCAVVVAVYRGCNKLAGKSLCTSCIRYRALPVASEQTTYSASVVDVATSNCFFDCQSIGPPFTRKI
jgi:hypothetical protein